MTYAYDNANRLATVTDWNSRAVGYAYDDAGRMTTATLPASTNIVSAFAYDNADRLTSVSHVQNGSTTIASASYTLDAVGNRTQRVDQQGTHTYAYDNAYRLTSVTYPGPATTSYAFDAFGNRTSKTEPGSQTTNYAYNDGDRLTSVTPPGQSAISYTWDNNGDLTARGSDSFSWDYEDRMTSATVGGTTTTFAYRGDGLRHSKTTGGNTTTFTWDVNAGLPVVLDDGNQYVYGAGLESMVTAGGTYYYLADGLGSTMAIVDTSGTVQKSYTYDVYGKATPTGSLANEFDFAGQETDGSTGLQYLRARYMDTATGTFISREPMAVSPGWTGNHYGYAGGDPVDFADPTGLSPVIVPPFGGCMFGIGPFCKDKWPGDCNGEPLGSAPCLGPRAQEKIVYHSGCISGCREIEFLVATTGEYSYSHRIHVTKEHARTFDSQQWTGRLIVRTLLSRTKYEQKNGITAYVFRDVDDLYYVIARNKNGVIVGSRHALTKAELDEAADLYKWKGYKP